MYTIKTYLIPNNIYLNTVLSTTASTMAEVHRVLKDKKATIFAYRIEVLRTVEQSTVLRIERNGNRWKTVS